MSLEEGDYYINFSIHLSWEFQCWTMNKFLCILMYSHENIAQIMFVFRSSQLQNSQKTDTYMYSICIIFTYQDMTWLDSCKYMSRCIKVSKEICVFTFAIYIQYMSFSLEKSSCTVIKVKTLSGRSFPFSLKCFCIKKQTIYRDKRPTLSIELGQKVHYTYRQNMWRVWYCGSLNVQLTDSSISLIYIIILRSWKGIVYWKVFTQF